MELKISLINKPGQHPIYEIRARTGTAGENRLMASVRCLSNEKRVTVDGKLLEYSTEFLALTRAIRDAKDALHGTYCAICGRPPANPPVALDKITTHHPFQPEPSPQQTAHRSRCCADDAPKCSFEK